MKLYSLIAFFSGCVSSTGWARLAEGRISLGLVELGMSLALWVYVWTKAQDA